MIAPAVGAASPSADVDPPAVGAVGAAEPVATIDAAPTTIAVIDTVDAVDAFTSSESAPSRASTDARPAEGRPYANPYLAGVGLGLALLAAFVVAGRGLGASGAFSSAVAAGVSTVAPGHAAANSSIAAYLTGSSGGGPLADWLVVEIVGVTVGGFVSAWFAGRLRATVERGPRISDRGRLAYAFAGGVVTGVGAKLARGCTSGQALTGGALLSVGSWLFIATAFAAAYLAAPLVRRQWT